jgi:hypothetical protein
MSVCVAIPSTRSHSVWLGSVLRSVKKQTLRPCKIVVFISGVAKCPPSTKSVLYRCSPFLQTSGRARNVLAKMCNSCEYTSFIDGDDLMLPYALQRMYDLMRKNNATVGLHDYFYHTTPKITYSHAELVKERLVRESYPPFQISAHHGHVTVKTSSYIPQDVRHTRKEDSQFVIDLWKKNESFVYTREPLTRYMHRPTRYMRKRIFSPFAGTD